MDGKRPQRCSKRGCFQLVKSSVYYGGRPSETPNLTKNERRICFWFFSKIDGRFEVRGFSSVNGQFILKFFLINTKSGYQGKTIRITVLIK